jgi:TolB-like protein
MGRVVAFVREIRERRIFQYFVSYLAGGWVALEVADHFVDRGLIPEIAYRVVLLWYIGGMFACLIIGWFHGERGDQRAPRIEVFSLSMVALVCLGFSSMAVSSYYTSKLAVAAAENGANLRRVAVLYFKDITRGGELQYLADGLTEDLIAELERIQPLDVISRNGVGQFRSADAPVDSIAKVLEAGTVVDGTVERVGDRVRVNLRLMDGLSGAEFRRATLERPLSDLFAIRDDLAKETSNFLRVWLGEEVRLRELARATESTAAWALYQRAEKLRKDAEERYREEDLAGMARLYQQADSLLAQVQLLDAAWAEPLLLRGRIAYRQSRVEHDAHHSVAWIDRGLRHVEEVLARDPRHAEALEIRGTLKYWHYLLDVTPDPQERDALLAAARQDLQAAVERDPTLASAHHVLSHLLFRTGDVPSGLLEAVRAYEQDAYLDMANEVLARLATGYYDLQDFTQGKRWCDEGARRFAEDHRFTHCQLLLMTTRVAPPDVATAWKLRARLDSLAPPALREVTSARGEMYVSGVIARAGLPDSARAVLNRAYARVTPAIDPKRDLLRLRAYMLTLQGDVDGAIDELKRYAAVVPNSHFDHYWWWQEVRAHPRFAELPRASHGYGDH